MIAPGTLQISGKQLRLAIELLFSLNGQSYTSPSQPPTISKNKALQAVKDSLGNRAGFLDPHLVYELFWPFRAVLSAEGTSKEVDDVQFNIFPLLLFLY